MGHKLTLADHRWNWRPGGEAELIECDLEGVVQDMAWAAGGREVSGWHCCVAGWHGSEYGAPVWQDKCGCVWITDGTGDPVGRPN